MSLDSVAGITAGSGSVDSSFFKLPSALTIETAEHLASELKKLSSSTGNIVTLDASDVRNITTPGLQLIISLEKTLSAAGRFLSVNGGDESFAFAFRDSGLENLLNRSVK